MKTVEEFLDKVARLDIIGLNPDYKDAVLTSEGFTIRLQVYPKYTNSMGTSVQVVVSVIFRGKIVQSWGATSIWDNAILIKDFARKLHFARLIQDNEEQQSSKIGKELWERL